MTTRAVSRFARLLRKSEIERAAIETRDAKSRAKLALLVDVSSDASQSSGSDQQVSG